MKRPPGLLSLRAAGGSGRNLLDQTPRRAGTLGVLSASELSTTPTNGVVAFATKQRPNQYWIEAL